MSDISITAEVIAKVGGMIAGVLIIAGLIFILSPDKKETVQPSNPPRITDYNAAYEECVVEAASYLYSMIPDITRAQAISQARTSPKCSPLK